MEIIHRIIMIAAFIQTCYSDWKSENEKCPPIIITDPCECVESLRPQNSKQSLKILTCDTTDFYNISEVTRRISAYYNKRGGDGKHFDKLKMENINRGIKSLEKNFFNDLFFDYIYINSEGLERINEDTFHYSRSTLKQLYISVSTRNVLFQTVQC